MQLQVHESVTAADPAQWNALVGDHPFLRHEFLLALEQSGCLAPRTGWQPLYLTLYRDEALCALMPLYLKLHSRGEFVFDHSWAEAFARHGLSYYPKLLCAVPFTPVAGPRLVAHGDEERRLLAQAAVDLAREYGLSSLHVNFPDAQDLAVLREAGYLLREGVQFHWLNQGYGDYEGFLAALTHDKRKKLRQDSRRVAEAGIRFEALRGEHIGESELAFFFECYQATYRAHHAAPYLNLDFFRRLHAAMPDTLLLIAARRGDENVACALNIIGDGVLYGRYWGTREFVSGLHFEACYAQAIAWCIAQGFQRFEGGAQGEHKMARGLLPVPTWSAHWIADERFREAIADFLRRETRGVEGYLHELEGHTPFRSTE